jgi:hypothetical protein
LDIGFPSAEADAGLIKMDKTAQQEGRDQLGPMNPPLPSDIVIERSAPRAEAPLTRPEQPGPHAQPDATTSHSTEQGSERTQSRVLSPEWLRERWNSIKPSSSQLYSLNQLSLKEGPEWDWAREMVREWKEILDKEPRSEPRSGPPPKLEVEQRPEPMGNDVKLKLPNQDNDPIRAAAREYIGYGWTPLRLAHRSKKVPGKWDKNVVTESNINRLLGDSNYGIGIWLGEKSGGLVDFDLDWPEAARLAKELGGADKTACFGRSGKPYSHLLYVCEGAKSKAITMPKALMEGDTRFPGDGEHRGCILEVRSNKMTVFPPSLHEGTGQRVEWHRRESIITWSGNGPMMKDANLLAFLALCARCFPAKGSRFYACQALTGALTTAGYAPSEVDKMVRAVCRVAGVESSADIYRHGMGEPCATHINADEPWPGIPKLVEYLALPVGASKTIRAWLGLAPEIQTATGDGRALIEHNELDLTAMLDATEAAMRERNAPVFQRDDTLVRIHHINHQETIDENTVRRSPGALVIRNYSKLQFRERMHEHVQFWKPGKDKDGNFIQEPIAVPMAVVGHVVDRNDRWSWRPLQGIVEVPTLRADGTVLSAPGYDPVSELYYDPGGTTFADIPERPTKDDALAALGKIDEVIKGFPFDGHPNGLTKCPSRSVALSLILSLYCCRAVKPPMHLLDASTPGTGKSLLVDAAALIATGKVAAHMDWDRSLEENVKRLSGVLYQGDLMLSIDNVDQPIGGSYLNSILTQPVVQVRILGLTGQHHLPTSLLVCASGNNLRVKGDMPRRCIKCRMDAKRERPQDRKFDVNLMNWIPEHRHELVPAALTILRAFAVTDDHDEVLGKITPLGNFEGWSDRVRGALIWVGEIDPVASAAEIQDDEEDSAKMSAVLACWVGVFGAHKSIASTDDIFHRAVLKDAAWKSLGEVIATAGHADRFVLKEALTATTVPRELSQDGLGRFLSDYVDRVYGLGTLDNRRFYRLRKRLHPDTRRVQYLVEEVEP